MTNTVIKKGYADWDDLVGKEISFDWSDGWDDYLVHGTFEGVDYYVDGYPKYYILVDGGGVSVRDSSEVQVTVHD